MTIEASETNAANETHIRNDKFQKDVINKRIDTIG